MFSAYPFLRNSPSHLLKFLILIGRYAIAHSVGSYRYVDIGSYPGLINKY
jgi:hypothetical protein